jgi:hypothetical protein
VARNGAKSECGGKKISKCLKFSSRHLHRAITAECPSSGTKWREHIALWRKQSAYWNPLECNGAPNTTWLQAIRRHLSPINSIAALQDSHTTFKTRLDNTSTSYSFLQYFT